MKTCLALLSIIGINTAVKAVAPNIIVFISDDQNSNSLGCYGAKFETPNIDRLAREGVRHTRAYTTSTLCVPTRYSCLTGAYPSRCRNELFGPLTEQPSIRNGAFFCDTDRTVVTALRAAGYSTGATGKWHNDSHSGFELPADADPADPSVVAKLKGNQAELRRRMNIYGFDYSECQTFGNLSNLPDAMQHHNVEYTVKGALDFLAQAPAEKPFFLWVAFTTTHGPRERIDSGDIRLTPEGYTDKHLGVIPPRSTFVKDNEKWIDKQTMLWMDAGVGAVLKKLDDGGLSDNTLVIFLSDQQNSGKATPYECGSNIPFIARWPEVIKPGTVNHTLLDVTDMAATFLDIANAKPVEGMYVDGMSIVPVWKGETETLKPAIYTEIGFSKSVVTRDFKYIAIRYNERALKQFGNNPPVSGTIVEHTRLGTFNVLWEKTPFGQSRDFGLVDPDQLYDLRKDPGEKVNLANNPEYDAILKEMKEHLSRYIRDIGRPFGEF